MTDRIQPDLTGNADQTPAPTQIHINHDDLAEVGWLRDTHELKTRGWEAIYLAALSTGGKELDAAEEAGVSVRRVQERIRNDAIFAELHGQALARRNARMRDLAYELASQGVPRTYKRKDGTVIETREPDTRFLEFWLAHNLPEFKADKDTLKQLGDGGIHINFQIGEGPPPNQAIEGEAQELTE